MKIREVPIKKARIEMVPLIDSFFLILVYFIYAFLSMSVHRGIPLSLPAAATSIVNKAEHHGISISRDGSVYFDRDEITLTELKKKLKALRTVDTSKEIHLFIYGDAEASHGNVMQVFDGIREAGIRKVFIETDPKRYDK